MKITLDKKILAGFVACSTVLLVVSIFSFKNSETFVETNRSVNHTQQVLYQFEQILLSSVNAESGVRGYAIAGSESFLELYTESRKALKQQLTTVRELTRDNPVQQAHIDDLEKIVRQRLANFEKCIELGRAGNLDGSRDLIASGEGRLLQDKIRDTVLKAKQVEQKLLSIRSEESARDLKNFNTIFIVLLAVIITVLAIVYVMIMTNIRALRKAEAEANDKNWNLTGSSELVKRMQGNKGVEELGDGMLSWLTAYLNAQVGSLYVRDHSNSRLRLKSVHALDREVKISELSQSELALVEQVASENREILIKDIVPHSYDVHTTFGKIKPKNVLLGPLALDGKVVGVIELGSIHDFTEKQREHLRMVSNSMAIALTSAQSREEVRELLEETQRQSEELEAQQHELRQANEELQAKSDLLERSEGILKVQQEELQQANAELEEKANMLEEQKSRLVEARDEIEMKANELTSSSKYKSEFLANMSHELRTPLNSILILSQLLSENKNKHLSDKEIEYAKNIHNSGADLLNLINEILDLSKVEAGKIQLDIADFWLSESIGNLRSTFSEIATSKSVSFEITCKDENIRIKSDRQRMEQILKNLLSNAFKFTNAGGKVTLNITHSGPSIISFAVADTGIGIPKDKMQVIFEAFQQADGSTKRKYGGTGLGLSISRELATALGGSIQVSSEEGKGSTFIFSLPLFFDPERVPLMEKKIDIKRKDEPVLKTENIMDMISAGPSVDDRDNLRENDRVILIIEDDEKFALMLLEFIRERNYKGIIATQGTSGISYARHFRPDAIILDMKLPVMDGFEVLNHLKSSPDLRHIPVQIISGFDRQKESLELGAFDYLRKPVAIPELHKAFDKIEKFTSRKLKKLLIIEDNKQQNNAIRELIGNGDVKSFSAYSGHEAQEMLMKEAFDCIIVDLGLPDMSGFDLLEKIKSDQRLKMIPVIVYTGKDLRKDEAARLKTLSDTVVLKTANSHERLLDETMLFLHRVEAKLPREKQMIIRKLHRSDEALRGKTILLVDDDIRNIYSLTSALEDEGLICITAENGKAGLNILASGQDINLVLMDIMMPEMDGYEATTEIRKIEKFKKLPIIALTAKAMKGDKEKCLAVGMSDYISKPVNVDQLLSLMRVWLYKSGND